MGITKKADVVIIGGGVMGNATAYYLAKAGKKVIVLDRENIANGASVRNGGINKINGRGLGELPIAMLAAKEIWPYLSKDLGIDVEYKEVGGYRTAVDEEQFEYMCRFKDFASTYGITLEDLSGAELRKKVPAFSDKITHAVRCKEEGRANPMRTTLGYYSKGRELGVEYICGEKVVALEERAGKIHAALTENDNRYEADQILVSAGYESRKILDTVGIDVPMYTYYEEIFVTEKLPRILDELFISAKVSYYGHQAENGSIVFGGSSGFGNFPNRGWYENNYQEPKRLPATARGLLDIFPSMGNVKVIRGWSGWMDISPDDSMMIGEAKDISGLFIACGFSGHGFGLSVGVGKVMSEIMQYKPSPVDISYLQYDRFDKQLDMFTGRARTNLINDIQKK